MHWNEVDKDLNPTEPFINYVASGKLPHLSKCQLPIFPNKVCCSVQCLAYHWYPPNPGYGLLDEGTLPNLSLW